MDEDEGMGEISSFKGCRRGFIGWVVCDVGWGESCPKTKGNGFQEDWRKMDRKMVKGLR